MPTLYTMPGTCALAPNIAAAWLDAPVTIHNMAHGDQRSDEYLAINPHGKVPALRFDDGDVLTEATAILAWLGAQFGSDRYARDTALGRKEAESLSYMTSEVHADYGPHFSPGRFADDEDCQIAVQEKAYEKLSGHYRFLDGQLTDNGGEWLLGERTFADAYLYVLTRWIDQTPISIEDTPALKRFRERMDGDEGVRTALERQGMAVAA